MKFAFQVPIKYIKELDKENDYLFVLAQYLTNPKYLEFIQKTEKNIILDNGASELGESIDIKEYKKIIDLIKPDTIIIPDVLFNKKKSDMLEKKFMKLFSEEELSYYEFMRVVQGATTTEYCQSLLEIANGDNDYIIGISRSRRLISNGYSYLLNILKDSYTGNKKIKIHILGTENPLELEEFALYDNDTIKIVSTDTSLPINYSVYSLPFPKIKASRDFVRVKGVDLDWSGELDISLTKKNIKLFKSYYVNTIN